MVPAGENNVHASLVSELLHTRSFEDAAMTVLSTMLEVAASALSAAPGGARGRVLRGVVHLRPDDGYRRLWALSYPGGATGGSVASSALSSATAWRWICEQRGPLSIDLVLGMAHPWSAPASGESGGGRALGGSLALDSDDTRQRFLGRDATHLHVLPLHALRGAVDGMISVEASCPGSSSEAFFDARCREPLSFLASVSAPYLTGLPLRPARPAETDALLPVVGESMAPVIELLGVFAQQEETLLIAGPTGAGKSRVARWCHARSSRGKGPFEVLDLLGVPEGLQMAEIFGWKRGAFSGAIKDTPGALARAEGGTLFIDEIDKLSLPAQAGLLRVLEERVYRPVGEAGAEHKASVRFVIGTNVRLIEAVRAGTFREDLYFRIHVLPVRVPPLSERLDELPAWAAFMAARRHREAGGEGEARFAGEAMSLLLGRAWPGNLRQLDNIVRRAYAIALLGGVAGGEGLLIEARHLARALANEDEGGAPSLVQQLRAAALAFVTEAERRDEGLSLDLADAFRGIVLGTAAQKLSGRDAALSLLGMGGFVKSRNQHKIVKREVERVRELAAALGGDAARALSDLTGAAQSKDE
ncbi:MAG: sigma 54-interacting transcriptional regulator [Polyangiaceae bacterium]